MEINRREFLKLLGVSGAGTAIGAWSANAVFSIPDDTFQRVIEGPRIETWANSICTMCPGGCGIRVRLIDGIPVRVLGNPNYPINQGAVCPRAEASISMLFHPERIRQPLKRTGKRGENQWQKITWDEAIEILTSRLQKLRTERMTEKLVLMMQDNNTMITDFSRQFMRAFGSPNFLCLGDSPVYAQPVLLSQGLNISPTYDMMNTDYILNFGGDFLDDDPTPIRFNQIYVNLRERNGENKAEIVHISSYMSRTAANSSKSLQIYPGTMAALALGIANVMIRDNSYDKEFIKQDTHGFTKWKEPDGTWHMGFIDLVLEDYYPEKVAEITGVSAKEIVELARGFASSRKALAISGKQAAFSTNSLYTLWAIYCLNALKGNLGKSGGVLFPKQRSNEFFSDFNANEMDTNGLMQGKIGLNKKSTSSFSVDSFEQLLHTLENDEPYAIDTLIFSQVNPLTESTCQNRFASALQNVPFIVSCSSFLDETTMLADLVLPESVYLENWEFSRNVPLVEFTHLGVQHPVITPLPDTRHFGDILLHIAQSIGSPVADALPWENYEGFLHAYANEIYNKGEGIIVSERVDLSWIKFLKKRGWHFFDYSTFDEFWDVLVEKGGWWIPSSAETHEENIFKTKSGKFEFYSQSLQVEMEIGYHEDDLRETQFEEMLNQMKIKARGDLIYMPHFEFPRYDNKNSDFPYHLLSYQSLSSNNGIGVPLGLLQELSGLHSHEYWNCWVEINPQTAHRLGINEDDYVHIISPKGQISVKAKILPTVMPDVVMMPAGRFINAEIYNPYSIFNTDNDLISGVSSLTSTMVRVVKDLNT